ncbi:HNH endonuclease [Streptomyces sp. NRRL F-5630]
MHSVENLVPACQSCNRAKGNRDPWDFLWSLLDARSGPS